MESDAEEILSQLNIEVIVIRGLYPWLGVMITNNANTAVSPNLKTFENPLNQTFDFPSTMMYYIWQEMFSYIYIKLLKTCKYFYLKERISVIRIACITTREYHLSSESSLSKSTIFSLSHFHQICYQKLAKRFINPEFLLSIALIETSIMKSKGDKLNCEEIMQKIPKAIKVELQNINITSETFSKISNFPRINKLRTFHLYPRIHDHYLIFYMKTFKEFLKRSAAPKACFRLYLQCENKTRLAKDTDEMEQF